MLQQVFDVPVVFAKKTQTKNIAGDVYTTKVESFTHGRVYDIIVSKEFLGKGDKVLLIDDFLCEWKSSGRTCRTGYKVTDGLSEPEILSEPQLRLRQMVFILQKAIDGSMTVIQR